MSYLPVVSVAEVVVLVMADKEVLLEKLSSSMDNEIAMITATMTTNINITKEEIAMYFLVFDIALVFKETNYWLTKDMIHLVNYLMHNSAFDLVNI